jgi:hypothetical protein
MVKRKVVYRIICLVISPLQLFDLEVSENISVEKQHEKFLAPGQLLLLWPEHTILLRIDRTCVPYDLLKVLKWLSLQYKFSLPSISSVWPSFETLYPPYFSFFIGNDPKRTWHGKNQDLPIKTWQPAIDKVFFQYQQVNFPIDNFKLWKYSRWQPFSAPKVTWNIWPRLVAFLHYWLID